MKARIRSGDFVIRNSSFVLFLLLATCHLPVATAQEIVTSTPIHNRTYNSANPLFVLQPGGNQTGDDQQWKDGAGTVVTWVDKNGVLHTSGGSAGLIRSINGLTAFDQFLTVGCTSGLDVNIQPNVDTNAICFPDASATARGLVTTGAQVFGGNKVFNNDLATNGAFSALGVSSQAQSNISAVTFTGAGLDDLTAGGTYTADNSLAYCVAIDGTGPDTFSWGTGGSCVNGALTVAITGAAQTLSNGITVTFAAVLGHTLTNQWDFVASEVAPLALADATGTPILTCHNSGAGCPVGGFPRLDQVLDPNVSKQFIMGANPLTFTWNDSAGYIEFDGITTENANGGAFFLNTVKGAWACPGCSDTAVVLNHVIDGSASGSAGQLVGILSNFQNPNVPSTLSISEYDAFQSAPLIYGAGTSISIGDFVHYSAFDCPANVVSTCHGIWIENQTTGLHNNYSIKTEVAPYGGNLLGDRLTVKSNAAAVQPVTFTGAGLNDATSGGTYTGLDDLAYCVQIDGSVPSPDTFEWGTGGSCSNGATGVGITGAAQNLSNGVQITFAAIDGHTIGDNWKFTAYAPIPLTLQDHNGNITAEVRQTGDVLGRRFFANTGTALVAGDFVPSGGWGASGSVAVTSASTDQSFHITVTAAGAGQGLNPTVAFTFKDGTWTTVPIYVCSMETGGTGALSFFTPDNTSATVLTLTYAGTPTVNLTYQVACNAWGH